MPESAEGDKYGQGDEAWWLPSGGIEARRKPDVACQKPGFLVKPGF
jgi:hypothetical protein